MCPKKNCTIYDRCEKDPDQLLYCRYVEALLKLALLHRNKVIKEVGIPKLIPCERKGVNLRA